MGYPPSTNEENKKNDIYIVYRLEPKQTEPEWAQYKWNISEVSNAKGNQISLPKAVRLSELILNARSGQIVNFQESQI